MKATKNSQSISISIAGTTITFPAGTTFNVSSAQPRQPRQYRRHYKKNGHSHGKSKTNWSKIIKISWANPESRQKRIAGIRAAKAKTQSPIPVENV